MFEIPSRCSRCESSNPAGPAPTMPACTRWDAMSISIVFPLDTKPRGTGIMIAVTDQAWEAIAGGYDLQVHVAPDVIGRRIDDIGLAHEFLAHGLHGFVLKSHYIPTAERAKVVTKAVPGIAAFGAITLNH